MGNMRKTNKRVAQLGKPSLIFGWGQQKRFDLVKRNVELSGKRILDVGCGIGMYSQKFFEKGAKVLGIDIDDENIKKAKELSPEIDFWVAKAEALPFENNSFDLIFLNEVLEHVDDDKRVIQESLRVLRPEGKIIIFAPNRFFPFETHGIYFAKKYIYGNIPFINWLPMKIRNLFCPHVRIYTTKTLKRLFDNQKVSFEKNDFVWPAFDKIERKNPFLGKTLKKIANLAEKNRFLKKFGISIFMIVKKKPPSLRKFLIN